MKQDVGPVWMFKQKGLIAHQTTFGGAKLTTTIECDEKLQFPTNSLQVAFLS